MVIAGVGPGPLTNDHRPEDPASGTFPAKEVVVAGKQTLWSGPAVAVEGIALRTTCTTSEAVQVPLVTVQVN